MCVPLITIGITCYREGEWLRECWESVLRQTDDRWVAVMVMDGTDHQPTRDVFDSLNHPKLSKFAMSENLGPYATRNKAFELTETPYHLSVDADDVLSDEAAARVLDTFARYPQCPMVYGDIHFFGSTDITYDFPPSYEARDYQLAAGGRLGSPWVKGYHTQLWERVGGFSQELARGAADHDFFIGALELGCVARHCGGVLYHYRVGHSGRVSNSYGHQLHEKYEIMVRRHPNFFRNRQRRRAFLAFGYKVSALTCYRAGQRLHASHLARRALQYGMWRNLTMWSIFVAGYLPPRIHFQVEMAARHIRRVIRSIIGAIRE